MIASIAYAVSIAVLGFFAWDGFCRWLKMHDKALALKEEIKRIHARIDVVHGDVVDLGKLSQSEFQRLSGKQAAQAISAGMFQPQSGVRPF